MKKLLFDKTFLLFLLICVISIHISFAQWEYKHASPTGNNLRKIAFATNTVGWIIGDGGTILKTMDGGSNWNNQYLFTHNDLIDLSVIDTNNLFVLLSNNQIYASSNGGETWELRSFFFGSTIKAISFTTITEGWQGSLADIQHTTDGGVTWASQFTATNELIEAVEVESNGYGIAATDLGSVLQTNNFGASWTNVANLTGTYQALDLASNFAIGLVIYNNTIYKSIDNGNTWSAAITTPTTFINSAPTSIKIINALNYIATTADGSLLYTSNGGSTWNLNSFMAGNRLNNCIGQSSTQLIAIGDNGKIIKSNNGGVTLTAVDSRVTNQELWGIHHFGTDFYAVGDVGAIVKSTNSGQSWTNLNSGVSDNLKSIVAINASTAVAVGNNGTILRSTNGGNTWSLVITGYSDDISIVHRLPNGILYAIGNNDLILKSINDGISWTFETTSFTGFQYHFTDVYFASNDTGFIATNSAEILTTDDGGQNWYLRVTGLFAPMTCLNFSDGLNGWIGSSNGEIFYTDNGGQSWTDRSMVGFTGNIHRLKFNDASVGWAFTDQGIFKTIDNGVMWQREFSPCADVHGIDFTGSNTVMAVAAGQGKIIGRNVDIVLTVGAGAYCAGHEYSFGAFTLGTFNAGNTFIAQLSDDLGNFDFPSVMNVVNGTIMNSITATIPSGIPPSSLYRVRIATTNPPMYSNISIPNLDIHDSPQGLIYANGSTNFNNGDSVILINLTGAIGSYQWFLNGTLLPGASNDSLVVYTPGNYLLNINDGTCDGNSNSIQVIVNGSSSIATLNKVSLKYYPNPVRDHLTVDLSNEKFQHFTIVDINGHEVLSSNGEYYHQLNIPMQSLSPGFYFLRLLGEKQSILKFIKE